MSKTNRYLLVAVAALFLLSVLTYRHSVGRADRFQRGQLFLANLDPDEITGIRVVKGEETVSLNREADRFVIAEKSGYPASNSVVNRLLRDLLEIGLERPVGSGAEIERELALEPPGEETVEIVLTGAGGKEMVRLRIGKTADEGPGNFVKRLDDESQPVYLTASGVYPTTGVAAFLDKQIVDHERSEVASLKGTDFELSRPAVGEDLELADLPASKSVDRTEVGRLESLLDGLRFEDVFVADAPEVQGLEFAPNLEIGLTDGSGYLLSLATREDQYYLKIRGRTDVQQVSISVDESEEELQEKAEMLTRADEIDAFNNFHGSWIYRISEFTAEKLHLQRDDLIETESD